MDSSNLECVWTGHYRFQTWILSTVLIFAGSGTIKSIAHSVLFIFSKDQSYLYHSPCICLNIRYSLCHFRKTNSSYKTGRTGLILPFWKFAYPNCLQVTTFDALEEQNHKRPWKHSKCRSLTGAFTGSILAFRYTPTSHSSVVFWLHLRLTLNRAKQGCQTKIMLILLPCPFPCPMWCSDSVLSWVCPSVGSVSSGKMKTRDPFFPSPLFWVTGRVDLSTEFLLLILIGSVLQLMLWPQELCSCSCTGCCSWLPTLSPLPSCTNPCMFTPGSGWISNPCTSASWRRPEPLHVLLWDSWTVKPVVWNERFYLSEPSPHETHGAFCCA